MTNIYNYTAHPKSLILFIFTLMTIQISAKTHEVIVASNTFTPRNLQIEAGDTVRWHNTGGGHNVRASNGSFRCALGCDAEGGNGDPSFDLWSFEITFRTTGTTAYICEPHIGFGMQGSISVVEPTSTTVHDLTATVDNDFSPNDLTVMRGDIIKLINGNGVHNLNATDNSLICAQGCLGDGTTTDNSPTGFPFQTYIRMNDVKEIPYFCANHEISGTGGIIRVLTDTFFANGFE
jgi:plastocyanin